MLIQEQWGKVVLWVFISTCQANQFTSCWFVFVRTHAKDVNDAIKIRNQITSVLTAGFLF